MAAINHQHRRREHLEHLAHLERLAPLEQRRRARLEHPEHLERLGLLGQLEHLGHRRQNINRGGLSGYVLAKRIYPKSMQKGVDYKIKVIQLQIDSSDSQLPF